MLLLNWDAHVVVFISLYNLCALLLIVMFNLVVNAADNKQRDKNMTCIKVSIDP